MDLIISGMSYVHRSRAPWEAVIVRGMEDENMAVTWVLVWGLSVVLGYFFTEGATLCCVEGSWDRATREFTIICSLLLGPVYLLIAAELLLFAAMGKGLSTDMPQRYKA